VKRGEARWYTFEEPNKRRPVLILTRTPAIRYLDEIVVAQITSTMRAVPSSEEDGMAHPCDVNLHQITLVRKSDLGTVITVLSSEKMREVAEAIRYSLDLGLFL
jgi:mRNA interferase MazF